MSGKRPVSDRNDTKVTLVLLISGGTFQNSSGHLEFPRVPNPIEIVKRSIIIAKTEQSQLLKKYYVSVVSHP